MRLGARRGALVEIIGLQSLHGVYSRTARSLICSIFQFSVIPLFSCLSFAQFSIFNFQLFPHFLVSHLLNFQFSIFNSASVPLFPKGAVPRHCPFTSEVELPTVSGLDSGYTGSLYGEKARFQGQS